MIETNVVDAIFEIFEMTRTPRSGWQRAGVKVGIENVAEHSCLTAQIAFILAVMEDVENPEAVACEALFHDNGEPRTGDQNRLNTRYLDKSKGELAAFNDFTAMLPDKAQIRLRKYFTDFEDGQSISAKIVRDADLLQMAFQGKYYVSIGYKAAQRFVEVVESKLQTKSAKNIYKALLERDFFEWSLV